MGTTGSRNERRRQERAEDRGKEDRDHPGLEWRKYSHNIEPRSTWWQCQNAKGEKEKHVVASPSPRNNKGKVGATRALGTYRGRGVTRGGVPVVGEGWQGEPAVSERRLRQVGRSMSNLCIGHGTVLRARGMGLLAARWGINTQSGWDRSLEKGTEQRVVASVWWEKGGKSKPQCRCRGSDKGVDRRGGVKSKLSSSPVPLWGRRTHHVPPQVPKELLITRF